MEAGRRSLAARWTGLCLLLAVVGCGPGAGGDRQDEAAGADAARTGATALTTQDEANALLRFWLAERYLRDGGLPVWTQATLHRELLARAQPDECFNGVGQPITQPVNGKCATGRLKTNDAYVWGLTRVGTNLFFGTLSNTLCLVLSGYLQQTTPALTSEYVCEMGQSQSGFGDFRAPNLFKYDLATDQLVSLNPPPGSPNDVFRWMTGGLRSAGNFGGVVFLAGPGNYGGVNVFALDGATGDIIGTPTTLGPGKYNNVRMWVVAKDALYVGVGAADGGYVLRWTGTKADPYHFEEVGKLKGDAANMVLHSDGRIYVTTWPVGSTPAGLFRSPVIPDAGLTPANLNDADWTKPLWLAAKHPLYPTVPSYDPDLVTGLTTGGGAIASYNGKLYWGTMNVPALATATAMATYHLPSADEARTFLGTHRAIAVFELKFVNGAPVVSMLAGEKYLPRFDQAAGGYTIRYDLAHATGFTPRWGPSGFGNLFSTYTWAMTVYRNQVFVGDFDWSQVARTVVEAGAVSSIASTEATRAFLLSLLKLSGPGEGAELIRFNDTRVLFESTNGLGNDRNYGIRNMITDGTRLWVGTANPMNLDPRGGWELYELTP